jgi:hypothetical protein
MNGSAVIVIDKGLSYFCNGDEILWGKLGLFWNAVLW